MKKVVQEEYFLFAVKSIYAMLSSISAAVQDGDRCTGSDLGTGSRP